MYRLHSTVSDPTLGIVVAETFLDFGAADRRTVSMYSGFLARLLTGSPFANIVNISISLKLFDNLPYCLSFMNFSNCKRLLVSLLALHKRFSLKLQFHQFPFCFI